MLISEVRIGDRIAIATNLTMYAPDTVLNIEHNRFVFKDGDVFFSEVKFIVSESEYQCEI